MLTIHNPRNLEQLKRLDSQDTDLQGTMSKLRELTGHLKAIQLQWLETQQDSNKNRYRNRRSFDHRINTALRETEDDSSSRIDVEASSEVTDER